MKPTILIVEDDSMIGNLLFDALKGDFDTTRVEDAEHARAFIEHRRPDMILLDIILPGMDGFTFLKQLKESDTTKDIPVLILSNLGDQADIEKGRKLGAIDYIVKSNVLPRDIIRNVKAFFSGAAPASAP